MVFMLFLLYFPSSLLTMSAVHELTKLLGRLERIQRQLADLHSRLRRGPLLAKSQEATIQNLQQKLEQAQARQKALILDLKEKERRNLESENAIARRKTQLAESKNNKEFQALKAQIAADEEANSLLADEVLEAMEKSENFVQVVLDAEAELKKAIKNHETSQKQFQAEEPTIRADLQKYTGELQAAENELSREFREVYDRLVKSHGGDQALAVITNQKFCGGCNQTVAINLIALVIQGRPVPCSSCGRLLYVPEGYQFASK